MELLLLSPRVPEANNLLALPEVEFDRDGTATVAEEILAEATPGVITSSMGWSSSGGVFAGDSSGTHDSSSKDETPESLAFTTAGDIFCPAEIVLSIFCCELPPNSCFRLEPK